MSNKNIIAIALVLAVAALVVAFGSLSTNKLYSIEQKTTAQSAATEIPQYVLYEQVFRLTIAFKIKAEADEEGGEEASAFATYFKDKAQLTEPENEILKQVAAEFIQEVQSIDEDAEELIGQLRKGSSEDYIEPPQELLTLQEERNSVALLYRSQLQTLLGTARFTQFDNFIQGEFASGIQVMPASSNLSSNNQGGRK